MHQVGDVVGDFPERAFEGDEGSDRNLSRGGEIGASPAPRGAASGPKSSPCARPWSEKRRADHAGARGVVAQREPAERAALQAERLHHRLRSDVFLHHAEDRRLVDLLVVVGVHRLRRQDAWPDQRDGKDQQGDRRELPVQVHHQTDAGDQLHERQQRAVGEMLDRGFVGRHVHGKPREDFTALGSCEKCRRQIRSQNTRPFMRAMTWSRSRPR